VPIDVLWFRIGREGVDDEQSLGYVGQGALVMLDRKEYWQCAYIIEKGAFERIQAAGLPAFRESIAELAHLPAQAVAEVDSWDKVKMLSVSVDHARAWAKEGVALIGDAAHAMSPIGGVGINYAVQDAVAAANMLIPALKEQKVSLKTLQAIQERRERPTLRMQRLQVFIQNRLLSPVVRRHGKPKLFLAFLLLKWFPPLRRIPARVIGIGFLPEHVSPEAIPGLAR
jgi:2-polyprenyl-6-methoxyphenol hydroxylase-like FAD-dependent oxidoreductase